MKNIFVIIPAYNEEKSIGLVVREIPKHIVSEIIVVNNNSTDATDEQAKLAGAKVLFESYRGYGAACLKGIEYLKNKNCDIVVFMDGDLSDYPEELNLLINPILQNNFDFVVGSRILGKREKGSLPFQSRFGSVVAGLLINLFWKIKYTDLGPFRAIKFEKLLQLNMNDKWYGWTVQMQVRAAKQKLKIIEVPVSYRKRIGKSKVTGTFKGTIMASIIILKTIFKEFIIH
ncbi:MAG TPA: glycosyltransferase family 2 protein [Ignavibacteriaceae bacterium]|nr:glycosyltransferase family 2 protein [Ignavibacteriaceae bacterium]